MLGGWCGDVSIQGWGGLVWMTARTAAPSHSQPAQAPRAAWSAWSALDLPLTTWSTQRRSISMFWKC